jgi:hypothetical protein
MKRFRSTAGLALAVFAVLGFAGPVAAQVQVPFKGRLSGMDIGTPIPNTTMASVKVTATGNATHLGKFTLTMSLTVDTAKGTGSGTFLFTAANSDTVFGTASGQAKLTAPGVLTIVENWTITGGTGRFAGSTGSFTSTRVKYVATNVTTASITGTISSPGRGN